MPARKVARVAWVWAGSAFRATPIAGRLGRYMSIASGPRAVSDPSRITRPQGVGAGGGEGDWEGGLADVTAPMP